MSEATQFDEQTAESFRGYYETVRGYVRQELQRSNLLAHLPAAPQQILDFGGGDGRDSIWLAGLGHDVTYYDNSAKMIGYAKAELKGVDHETLKRLRIISDEQDMASGYDAILSHGVLMYELSNPIGQLQANAELLNNGGILSLLTKGHEAVRRSLSGHELLEFQHSHQFRNKLGAWAVAYNFADLEYYTKRAGLELVAKYGVRLDSDDDYRQLTAVPLNELEEIVESERAAGSDPLKYENAQMLHIIATKPSTN
jgi:S-adenosylmethionine-dependent methyltransferase